jgi:hypothetical protein
MGKIPMTEHSIKNPTNACIRLGGFQLISIPEPTSAMLGDLGLLALLRRRHA